MTPVETDKIVAFPEGDVGIVEAFLRGLPSSATRAAYRQALRAFQGFLGGADVLGVTRRQVEAYRAVLEAKGRAPATICKHLSALSSFYGFALDEELVHRNPVASARRPRVPDQSPRRPLTVAEVQAMLDICDDATLLGIRDRAMVITLAVQGLRISEVLGLEVDDLAEEAGHKVATVTGKGGKVARVPLAAPTWFALTGWCTTAGLEHGPIFVGVGRNGVVVPGKTISQQAAWARLRVLARRAGVQREVHAHLFRHTAVTEALAAGVALHLVQDFARHADPSTTRRYDGHRQSLSNPTAHVLAGKITAGAK